MPLGHGIINLANTAGMVLGPIVAALIISVAGYHAIFPVETLICFRRWRYHVDQGVK